MIYIYFVIPFVKNLVVRGKKQNHFYIVIFNFKRYWIC